MTKISNPLERKNKSLTTENNSLKETIRRLTNYINGGHSLTDGDPFERCTYPLEGESFNVRLAALEYQVKSMKALRKGRPLVKPHLPPIEELMSKHEALIRRNHDLQEDIKCLTQQLQNQTLQAQPESHPKTNSHSKTV